MARRAAPTRAGQLTTRLSAEAASLEALLAKEGIIICLRIGNRVTLRARAAPMKAKSTSGTAPNLRTAEMYRFSIDRSNECL